MKRKLFQEWYKTNSNCFARVCREILRWAKHVFVRCCSTSCSKCHRGAEFVPFFSALSSGSSFPSVEELYSNWKSRSKANGSWKTLDNTGLSPCVTPCSNNWPKGPCTATFCSLRPDSKKGIDPSINTLSSQCLGALVIFLSKTLLKMCKSTKNLDLIDRKISMSPTCKLHLCKLLTIVMFFHSLSHKIKLHLTTREALICNATLRFTTAGTEPVSRLDNWKGTQTWAFPNFDKIRTSTPTAWPTDLYATRLIGRLAVLMKINTAISIELHRKGVTNWRFIPLSIDSPNIPSRKDFQTSIGFVATKFYLCALIATGCSSAR